MRLKTRCLLFSVVSIFIFGLFVLPLWQELVQQRDYCMSEQSAITATVIGYDNGITTYSFQGENCELFTPKEMFAPLGSHVRIVFNGHDCFFTEEDMCINTMIRFYLVFISIMVWFVAVLCSLFFYSEFCCMKGFDKTE